MDDSKSVAILMAAGRGKRLGGDVPKQFCRVNDKMLMEYALETFQNHPRIDEIVIVLPEEYLKMQELLEYLFNRYEKLNQVLAGGDERFQSSWSAVQWFVDRPDDHLLLHDAARPGMSARIVDDLLDALQHGEAAVTALPATDTVIRVDGEQHLQETLVREGLYYAQTPQAFRAGLLYDCFLQLIQQGGPMPTDESGLVARFHPEVPIKIVKGEARNFKVTYSEDLDIIQYYLVNSD